MRMGELRIAVLGAAAVFLSAPSARSDVVSITSSKDNTLYQTLDGSLSNGQGSYFFAGSTLFGVLRRGLIAFDVAGNVPAGSTIQSVELTLHMSRTRGGTESIELHRVLTDWGEGASDAPDEEGAGAPTAPGDASWIHTFAFNQFWQNPGGDFDGLASASALVTGEGFYTWSSTPDMVSDVQTWLDHPSHNTGWMVIGDEFVAGTAKRFDTRENADPSVRPVLTITYQPVPEPAVVIMLAACGLLGCAARRKNS